MHGEKERHRRTRGPLLTVPTRFASFFFCSTMKTLPCFGFCFSPGILHLNGIKIVITLLFKTPCLATPNVRLFNRHACPYLAKAMPDGRGSLHSAHRILKRKILYSAHHRGCFVEAPRHRRHASPCNHVLVSRRKSDME